MNSKVTEFISKSSEETKAIAKDLSKTIKKGNVICLYGDLGSGKTTFTQALAKSLGIRNRIISPTFIIVRSYNLDDGKFYHIDLYRTESKNDLLSLGIEELLSSKGNITVIEWAEKLKDLIPSKRIDLFFEQVSLNNRKILLTRYE